MLTVKCDYESYSATNSTGATEKNDTLKFKEMLSFLIGLQTPAKPDSFVVNVTCDWLINVGWPRLSSLHCNSSKIVSETFNVNIMRGAVKSAQQLPPSLFSSFLLLFIAC